MTKIGQDFNQTSTTAACSLNRDVCENIHTLSLSLSIYIYSVEVVFDDQCDVIWSLPKGVEPIPLFQTTSYNIDGDSLDLIGGVHGRTFHFQVDHQPKPHPLMYG